MDKIKSFELLILPYWEGSIEAGDFFPFRKEISLPLSTGDFKGKKGESLLIYGGSGRILLLGLGKQTVVTSEAIRRAVSIPIRSAQTKGIRSIHIALPTNSGLSDTEVLRAVAEGIILTNYCFSQLKNESIKESPITLLETVTFIGKADEKELKRLSIIGDGVNQVRDLVNGNADDVNPHVLAEAALSMERMTRGLKSKILDKKQIEDEKMGLLLAVNRASQFDPYLINLSYRGNPDSKEHIVLVGKGITYDTGGLALKSAEQMLTMKCDMAGAATVLATVQTAARLGLKINVTAVAPVTENAIGPRAYKNGDVYRSMSGKTVEITNTDAEGRLILADALTYAVRHHQPTVMIDLATLTGAIIVALGDEIAGLFVSDEQLAKDLEGSSELSGEKIWRMPLSPDYKEMLKSEIADLQNSAGRSGSSVTAALFLQEFSGSIPWAHLDIAGSAHLPKAKHYHTSRATGFGVRLLIDFLENRSA